MKTKNSFLTSFYIPRNLLVLALVCNSFTIVTAQDISKEVKIGDKLPDIDISKTIISNLNIKNTSTLRGKAVLLDFWAHWCGPCLDKFPKLDSLQKKYPNDLQVILVTQERRDVSEKMMLSLKKNKNIDLPSVVEDSVFASLFKHRIIPHYVWIDKNGIVMAITDGEQITEANIKKFALGEPIKLPYKEVENEKELTFNSDIKFYPNEVVPFDRTIRYSVLTKTISGVSSNEIIRGKNWNSITLTNVPIRLLFQVAFSNWNQDFFVGYHRLILENFDTREDSLSVGVDSRKSKEEIKRKDELWYNYELFVPESGDSKLNKDRVFSEMQKDINAQFLFYGLQGKKEIRNVKILVLTKTGDLSSLKSKSAKQDLIVNKFGFDLKAQMMSALIGAIYNHLGGKGAVIKNIEDGTNFNFPIDIDLQGDMTSLDGINKGLQKYNLKLEERFKELEMIVITKAPRI